ncbi:MAG: ribonuclease H-like domain-containing protein [Myxococcota bacterium]
MIDPAMSWTPPEPEAFPPIPLHKIVAFGAMAWDADGPKWLRCLGGELQAEGYEKRALQEFAAKFNAHEPTLVTWNGRGFDVPVIVARCLHHRIPLPRLWRQSDYFRRYSAKRHVDLQDQLIQTGAGRSYKLDLASKLIGRGGKGAVTGDQVAGLWDAYDFDAIRTYVLSDVMETAHVWVRWMEQTGEMTPEQHDAAVEQLDALEEAQGGQ